MKKGISLISREKGSSTLLIKIKKIVNFVSVFLLMISIAAAGVIFSYFLIYSKKTEENKIIISELEVNIKGLERVETYLVAVTDRAGAIEKINASRFLPAKIINNILPVIIEGYSFSSFDLMGEKIKIEGKCVNTDCLSKLNDKLDEMQKDKVFTYYTISDIGRGVSGEYGANLSFTK